ncbi:MAG: endo-1,4-beta-xylanase, partial [Prolixibacteraceae bacterium]
MAEPNKKRHFKKFTRRNFLKQNALALAGTPLLKAKAFCTAAENTGLKEVFKNDFKIGTAIGTNTLLNNDREMLNLVAREFNAVTAENAMKWGNIHPAEDQWNFEAADRLMEFGLQNDMFIQGHVLVWHSQVPNHLFTNKHGNQISKTELTGRMKDHITALVGRYKGKIHGWDVVNEAITPEEGFRKSPWFEILGPRFMEKAFHFAHEADPDAHLIYNDYGMDNPKRRDLIVDLVKRYKREGIPIHGIGMQGHFNLDSPSIKAIEKSIEAFASTGMRVHITELDVDVLPF